MIISTLRMGYTELHYFSKAVLQSGFLVHDCFTCLRQTQLGSFWGPDTLKTVPCCTLLYKLGTNKFY